MLTKTIVVNPINHEYHNAKTFKEQIATLTPVGVDGNDVVKLRSFLHNGDADSVGFDPDNPSDALSNWKVADNLVENENVRGFFHTHPAGVTKFSSVDIKAQIGMAKAFGSMPLWHAVTCLGDNLTEVVCVQMIAGRVLRYSYGMKTIPADECVMRLPLPLMIKEQKSDGASFLQVDCLSF